MADGDGAERRRSRRKRDPGNGNDPANVVDRDHVDRVVDVWNQSKLDGSLDESPNEIIGVGDCK